MQYKETARKLLCALIAPWKDVKYFGKRFVQWYLHGSSADITEKHGAVAAANAKVRCEYTYTLIYLVAFNSLFGFPC